MVISTKSNKRFRVWAEEHNLRNSKYAEREIDVNGTRTIYFNLPATPKKLFVSCVNVSNPKDEDFTISTMQQPPIKYDIYLDDEAKDFLEFATKFAQGCGSIEPNENGTYFKPKSSKFCIKYFPIIKDYATNRPIGTPARIGHNTGIIEVAKVKFDRYTIAMRIAILLHEFSHKYRNTKIGLPISDEVGADINALYIYLGSGWSKIDAICVFAKVFLKAQTDSNIQRIRKLQNYIDRFENQEFAKKIS
jgi:hypothetical protein